MRWKTWSVFWLCVATAAAALVIGRRGMELLERQDFTVTQKDDENVKLNLAGRGFKTALTPKA